MPNDTRHTERRRHPRFPATSNPLVLIPGEGISGTLLDISMSGLAFHYRSASCRPCFTEQECMLLGRDDLWLDRLRLCTVHDTVIKAPLTPGAACLRRRSMQFSRRSAKEKQLLKQFIWLNTKDPADEPSSTSTIPP